MSSSTPHLANTKTKKESKILYPFSLVFLHLLYHLFDKEHISHVSGSFKATFLTQSVESATDNDVKPVQPVSPAREPSDYGVAHPKTKAKPGID